jgi:transposase
MLVNPATVQALRGNKTDRIDARRIAEYLQYGLLRGSFVPPKPVRQLRELTRMRVHIQQDRNRVINRIGRLLETVNIKLGSVVSSIVGKSSLAILRRLADGADQPEALARLALQSLKKKIPELILALEGRPDAHFRWMLSRLLKKLEWLDAELVCIDAQLCEQMQTHADLLRRLDTIPDAFGPHWYPHFACANPRKSESRICVPTQRGRPSRRYTSAYGPHRAGNGF